MPESIGAPTDFLPPSTLVWVDFSDGRHKLEGVVLGMEERIAPHCPSCTCNHGKHEPGTYRVAVEGMFVHPRRTSIVIGTKPDEPGWEHAIVLRKRDELALR